MTGKFFDVRGAAADSPLGIGATETLRPPRKNLHAAPRPVDTLAGRPPFDGSTRLHKKLVAADKRLMKKSNDSFAGSAAAGYIDGKKITDLRRRTANNKAYYEVSERTKQLSRPKVRGDDPAMDANPFSVKRASLKYVASERILALALPRVRK